MKLIPLTQGYFAQVDDEDFDKLNQYKWRVLKAKSTFYATSDINDHSVRMHRLIMNNPAGMEVDHRDHNGLNNQKLNLRVCTQKQNAQNNKGWSSSPYLGVSITKRKNKYYIQARITVNKKSIHLGYFKTIEDAAKARDMASLKYFGEHAHSNFPVK